MTAFPLPARHTRRAVAFAFLALAGCGPADDIRTYTVPKAPDPKVNPPAVADSTSGEFRILGGMFPADDPVWFVKLPSKASILASQEAAFDQFLGSLKLPNDANGKPEWELPAGWQTGPSRNVMGATVYVIRAGSNDAAPELTVQTARGGVPMNLDRWANQQLGNDTPPADLMKYTRPVETKSGMKGLRVDITGPKNPSGGMSGMPPFAGGR